DGSSAWIVGDDGAFMSPISNQQYRDGALAVLGEDAARLVVVRGLWHATSSPDQVRARLLSVAAAAKIFREKCSLAIDNIELLDNLEMRVKFAKLPFGVLFDLSASMDSLTKRVERFLILLEELSGRYHRVREIDMGLESLATVRFQDEVSGFK